jgi:hypothetical protein
MTEIEKRAQLRFCGPDCHSLTRLFASAYAIREGFHSIGAVCLWAAEQRDLTRSNIKHLVRRIHKGNWASRKIIAEQRPWLN